MYTQVLRRQRVAFAIADHGFAISSPLFLPRLLLRLQFDQVEANHVGLCAQPADDRNRFAHGEAAGNGRAGCHGERYATRRMATSRIFEYIETYYNRERKHSAIGHKIPMQFEQAA